MWNEIKRTTPLKIASKNKKNLRTEVFNKKSITCTPKTMKHFRKLNKWRLMTYSRIRRQYY